ncbi:O-antigen ligase family protein [Microbacterium sp. YY-01]|uniref:O-antigen ligase family protein n=1 Tax=Microbacterium sp. YY-01 TaxID=3421634 RepID=UPI003D18297A
MVQHSRIAVFDPPRAPVRESTGRIALRALIVLVFIAAFAHSALYNLAGPVGALATGALLLLALVATGITALIRTGPRAFRWRRLPWTALALTALGLISLLWSAWPEATLLTWPVQAAMAASGIIIAALVSWEEIIRAMATALTIILIASLGLELWVAAVVRHPVLPFFSDFPDGPIDPHWYWVRGNLLHGGRIQGVVGNSNLLAMLCLIALIVFALLFVRHARMRTPVGAGIVLAGFLFVRSGSATAWVCLVAVVVTAAAVVFLRTAADATARWRRGLVVACSALLGVIAATLAFSPLAALLGRDDSLTGRSAIWNAVAERAVERPFFGHGFSSPWVPWDPGFDGWITDHGITVIHAHSIWLDTRLQLGALGVILLGITLVALTWRSWFFATDRPRWDLHAQRAYSPLALAPILIVVALLVQGLTESGPAMLWGWQLVVLLSFKLKSVPLMSPDFGEAAALPVHGRVTIRMP